MLSSSRRRSIERSRTVTSAPRPAAIRAALAPTMPPPITSTLPAATPGTPPRRTPEPPAGRPSMKAPAGGVGDRLVGDAGRAGVDQALGQLGVGRQVQVGEEGVARLEHRHLGGLGLLDLDDRLGRREDGGGIGDDRRALDRVVVVGDPGADAGPRLDEHPVAVLGQLAHAGRGHRDPVLLLLHLGRHADLHRQSPRIAVDVSGMVRLGRTARQASCLNLLDSTVMDEIDDRILGILATNGRASFAALGEAVGLSPHGTADRVRKLERDGVITGYAARIDPAGVGRSLDAFIDVRLLPTTDPEKFERRVAKLASVREMAFLTGRFDYQLRVACRDADDLNQTVRAIRQGGAAGTETRIVLRASRFDRGAARTD